MLRLLLNRLLILIPMLLGVSFAVFALAALSPSDPAEVAIRLNAMRPTPELLMETRHALGLDEPFLVRYAHWLGGILQGDFGRSFVTGLPVAEEIARAFWPSLRLAAAALVLILATAIPIGVFCSKYEGRLPDTLLRGAIFLASSMPAFWAGLLLIWLFSLQLGWLPTSGMRAPGAIVLPALTLSLAYSGTYVRLIRNAMTAEADKDWVVFARARGLSEGRIALRILVNSLTSSVTALGISIPKLMAGAFVVESIFAWPGLGRLCITAIFSRDLPVVEAYVLVMAVLFAVFGLLADLAETALDPTRRERTAAAVDGGGDTQRRSAA